MHDLIFSILTHSTAFTKQRSWAQVNTGLVCATGAAMFAKAISDEFKKYAQSSVNNKVTQEL